MNTEKEVLLSVKHLKKYFNVGKNAVLKAVDDVSFDIYKGETLGMVGESGCGKTTCGRTCIGLYDRTDGQVLYKGKDVHRMPRKDLQHFKKEVQMVFQDPYGSLDPRMTVAEIVAEGLDIHHLVKNQQERRQRVYECLEMVGLNREHANRFVHEFSGGQRQRIGIARALAVDPEFIVLDEPISALDVSIQAQIVNLLIELQKKMGLTYLFVAHDLSMVKHISDRIAVLYLGALVELAVRQPQTPLHPGPAVGHPGARPRRGAGAQQGADSSGRGAAQPHQPGAGLQVLFPLQVCHRGLLRRGPCHAGSVGGPLCGLPPV